MSPTHEQIAILGATGTVGSELLPRALAAGYRVRALVRRSGALEADALHVVVGDVRDADAVTATVSHCTAVLTTLGAGRGDDPATRRRGTANILDAMRAADIRRLVAMGGFHVHLPGDPANPGQKLMAPLLRLAPGIDLEDTHQLGRLVVGSDRDWTLVRSPRVVPRKPPGSYTTGILRLGPWSSVAPADVADFMLRCLADDSQIRRAPMICAA